MAQIFTFTQVYSPMLNMEGYLLTKVKTSQSRGSVCCSDCAIDRSAIALIAFDDAERHISRPWTLQSNKQ